MALARTLIHWLDLCSSILHFNVLVVFNGKDIVEHHLQVVNYFLLLKDGLLLKVNFDDHVQTEERLAENDWKFIDECRLKESVNQENDV